VVAAALIGGLTARRYDFLGSLVGVVVGTLPIYGLGVLQLTLWLHLHEAATLGEGLARAIAAGVVPFLPGDGIKALAAAYIASRPQVRLARERYLGRVGDG
jgi:biotin transporter BioY